MDKSLQELEQMLKNIQELIYLKKLLMFNEKSKANTDVVGHCDDPDCYGDVINNNPCTNCGG
jgi:hypothetical protein